MANFSNYAESGVLSWLFRSNTNNFARPNTLAIALCSGLPVKGNSGSTIPELPNANGYARINLGAPANGLFTEVNTSNPTSSGNITNVAAVTFAAFTGDVGMISGVAIVDSGVYGVGNMISYAALQTPRDGKNRDVFVFNISDFQLFLG